MFKEGSFPLEKSLNALMAAGTLVLAGCPDMTPHPAPIPHEVATPKPKETPSPRQELLQKGLDEIANQQVPSVQPGGGISYELREGVVDLPADEKVHVLSVNARPFSDWNGYSDAATGSVGMFLWNKEKGYFSYISQTADKNKEEMKNNKHFTFITPKSSDMEFMLSGNTTFAQDIDELQAKNILTLRSKNWTPSASNYSSSITGNSASNSVEVGQVWEKWAQLPSSRRFKLMDGSFIDVTDKVIGEAFPELEEPRLVP